ncbi:MAG: glycosyltransferase [Syntrophobacterales bacterium]|nr:glycosyltransferase [Syntrophobacterales bacterium]
MASGGKPFLLVQIDPPTKEFSGDHYYRTYVPLFALGNRSAYFHTVSLTNEHRLKFDLLKVADIVILSLVADVDLVPFVEERRKKGLITVYEWNDDVYNIPPWNPQYRFFSQPRVRRTMERLAKLSDAVQFSSTVLEKTYGWLNKRRVVFVNHLLPLSNQPLLHQGCDVVEIGYGGSAGHLYDVASIAKTLSLWLSSEKRARLNIMAAEPIVKLFSSAPSDRVKSFPTGSIFEYYRFLRNLHIGLAPLADTPFNRSRSDVKFLEYAIHGVVPVLQKTKPYTDVVIHGKTGLLFSDDTECISILRSLIEQPERRRLISREAQSYVLRERMIFQHVKEREKFYLELLKKDPIGSESYKVFRNLENLEDATIHGDYIMLRPTGFEWLLRNGLRALSEGKKEEAKRFLIEASKIDTSNYLPWLYLSECSKDNEERTRHLLMALKLNPRSIMAKWLIGNPMLTEEGST